MPGLAAKPIIDIALVVADSGDESAYVPALEEVGYRLRLRTPDWEQHRMFKGPDTDVNLHVFSPGSNEVKRLVSFRDHLRADAADRERYAARSIVWPDANGPSCSTTPTPSLASWRTFSRARAGRDQIATNG